MNSVTNYLRSTSAALRMLLAFTVILGIAYPMFITALAQIPGLRANADGSVITKNRTAVGSALLGQNFTGADGHPLVQYFQSRPSALVAGVNGSPDLSGASNYGPESPALIDAVTKRRAAVAKLNHVPANQVPADAITASGSGLDPDISPAYAKIQEARIASERNITVEQVAALVKRFTTGRALGFMGEPVVNVLELNLALDKTYPDSQHDAATHGRCCG